MIKKTQDEVLLENKKLRQEIEALKKTKISKNIKTVKASLKKNMDEEFYHTLFAFSPAGIIIEDKNGTILDVNPAWCKLLGYNRQEIIGKKIHLVAHPENKNKVDNNIKNILDGNISKHTVKSIKKDGSICYIQLNERAIILPNGEKGILSICQDMTQETLAGKALKESEERLKTVVDSTGLGFWDMNYITKKVFRSKHWAKMLGYNISEIKGNLAFWRNRIHPDDKAFVNELIQEFEEGNNDAIEIEHRLKTKDGKWKWILNWGRIVERDNSGKPLRALGTHLDITKRKEAEEELKRSEERYKNLFEYSPESIIIHSKGKILSANRAAVKFAEVKNLSDLIGKPLLKFVHPDYRKLVTKRLKNADNYGKPLELIEEKFITAKGNIRDVEVSAVPFFDKDNKISMVVFRDITDRKLSEKALRESEERFRTMFIQNRAVMLLVDPTDNQKIIDANKSAENFYGYERSQLLKLYMGNINLMSEHDRNVLMKKAIKNPQNYFQFKHKLSNGELKDVEVYASPIIQQDKKCMFVIVHDITERKKAEREITRLAAVVEQAVESIVITDVEGKINYVNKAFEKITGFKKAEALDQNPRILKSGRHDKAFYKDLWSTILSGNKWQGVIINKRKNGSLYYEKAAIFPVKNENGEILNFTGIMRDITLERKLEQQLQQVQKMEAIGTLSGGIAHDFNNILTVINGHSEIALMNMDKSNAVYEDLISILNAGKRAEKLTNQLLAFSRKQIHELQVININSTIKDLDKMLRRLIPEDIKIVSKFPEDLPFIKADPGQIEQILINLVINARDAINENHDPKNKKEIIIKTELVDLDHIFVNTHPGSQTGPHILLSVKDTGVGITSEVKNRIFEPFFTTKDVDKGTGLGLATVYGIVKQNDGSIYVESKEGQGTLFEIYWPITNESPGKDYIESVNQKEYSGKETILFVEDDEDVRNFASVALKSFGYNIIEARNGKNALQIVQSKKQTFDLIITDLIMPEMNGQELATKVYESQPKLKVLFVSGYTFEHLLKDGEINEGINFLQKPYTIQNMLKRIREILDGK